MSRRYKSKSLDRARKLEQARWERLLGEWLEVEKRRVSFEVVEREVSRKVDAGGLTLEVKADRIDRLADGTHAILNGRGEKLHADVKDVFDFRLCLGR